MTVLLMDNKGNYYHIKVKGVLDRKWADWFDGMTFKPIGEDETLLAGLVADQSALHGLLAKIRDLGITLISVQLIEKPEGNYHEI